VAGLSINQPIYI